MNKTGRFLVITAIVALTIISIATTYAALRFRTEWEREQQRALQAENDFADQVSDYEFVVAELISGIRTVEPTATLAGSDIGVYSARVIGVSGDYDLIFDWIGINPNPHRIGLTDESDQHQTLTPSPFSMAYVYGPESPGSDWMGLTSVEIPEFCALLNSDDDMSAALLDSDWLVSVTGPEYGILIQLP